MARLRTGDRDGIRGTTEAGSGSAEEQDSGCGARTLRRAWLRGCDHAEDRRPDRVLTDHDLPPLPRQGGPGARAVFRGFSLTRHAFPGDRSPGRSPRAHQGDRSRLRRVRPGTSESLPVDVHDSPSTGARERTTDRERKPRRGCLGDARRGRRRGATERGAPVG